MNYILTQDQLKTMLVLLGADQLFGLGSDDQILSRETVIRCIAELVRGGLLSPEDGRFRCISDLREMLQYVADPQRVFLWTCLKTGRRLEGYCAGTQCTLLECVPGQRNALRLILRKREELGSFFEEEGLLPERNGEGETLLPIFFGMPGEVLLADGTALGVLSWVDVFDPRTHQRSARGIIYQEQGNLSFAAQFPEKNVAGAYRRATLDKWLRMQTNGETE